MRMNLALAAAGCLVAGSLSAAPLDRLVSDYQLGEVFTSAAPGTNPLTGGTLVYNSGAFVIPDAENVLFVTFSAQADIHDGSALLMNASVQQGTGPHETLCQPLASLSPGAAPPAGWYTLAKLPQSTTTNNCNNGGGGTADCHDNTIYFSCCARLTTPDTMASVRIRLANAGLPNHPGTSFYEKSTIYVDAVSDPDGPNHKATQCQIHGVP